MIEIFDIHKHKDICPICNSDFTRFVGKREDWHNNDCNCFQQNKLWKDYFLANLPLDYYSKELNDYAFKDENKEKQYFTEINKYIEYIDKVFQSGSNLFLYNDLASTGKTFFATSILKEAYRKNYSIYFMPFINLYNEVSNTKDHKEILKRLLRYDFLVIDSVDKQVKREFLTDIKVLNFFEEFLKARVKPTIFTSQKSINSEYETTRVIKSCLKNKIYELHIDNENQYSPNNYWDRILQVKKEQIK